MVKCLFDMLMDFDMFDKEALIHMPDVDSKLDFINQLDDAKPYVDRFVEKFGYDLTRITYSNETGRLEPAYEFSDNLGYYSFDGILNSLNENK